MDKSTPTYQSNWATQIDRLKQRFGDHIEEVRMPNAFPTDVPIIFVKKGGLLDVLKFLKGELDFAYNFLADITATDEVAPEKSGKYARFEVVYNLYSHTHGGRIRLKVRLADGESCPSAVTIWPGADWAEREVWDMFGVRFSDHPDLRRILMDNRFVGHPLRKDYPLRGYQIFTDPEAIDLKLLNADESSTIAHVANADSDNLWEDSRTIINIGPTHPMTHGALRVVAKLNGETVEKSYCMFGYTHRAKEKLGENRTYHNFTVYTDRLNYCSALANNVTYAMAVEKLMAIEVPERAVWIRMICAEIARITDHLICIGINAVDLGAFTYFLYGFHQREEAYTLIEKLSGARLTTSYTRIGGLMADAPDGFEKEVKAWVTRTRKVIDEMDSLLTGNKIWHKRTVGVSVFNKEQCLEYSYSGPNARAAGIDRDLRRDQPCMFYKSVEFDVPVGSNGDVFDRYAVRLEEIRQSLNIIAQCADRMKKGPIWVDDKRVRIPEKSEVYNSMEALIHHFKFFMTGFEVPAGEVYSAFEAANGELGFYIVSKGGTSAHRMRIRGPSVWHFQGLSPMAEGVIIPDLVAGLGSINIIAGELDR